MPPDTIVWGHDVCTAADSPAPDHLCPAPPLGTWAWHGAQRMGSQQATGLSSRSHPAHALQACQWCPGAPAGLAQSCRLVTTAAYLCTPGPTAMCWPASMSHCEALAKQVPSHVKAFLHSQGC